MKKRHLKWIVIIIATNVLTLTVTLGAIEMRSLFNREIHEVIPSDIYIQPVSSPNEKVSALILQGDNRGFLTNERFFLALQTNGTDIIINRELSEGFGTYEGGIHSIFWVDDETVAIDRTVCDNNDTLYYHIITRQWR